MKQVFEKVFNATIKITVGVVFAFVVMKILQLSVGSSVKFDNLSICVGLSMGLALQKGIELTQTCIDTAKTLFKSKKNNN